MRVVAAVAVLLVAVAACGASAAITNNFPVIGIMDQPLRGASGASYIASSYIKYLESSGARVVPLSYRANATALLSLVTRLNGVLFTGGGTDLRPGQQYYESAKVIYDYALQANDRGDYFPLWGTCMGFQLLSILTANDASVLASNAFDSYNLPIPLIPTSLSRTSRLLGPSTLSDGLYVATMTQNITMNNHHDGVFPEVFASNALLSRFFNVLSTNVDRKGKAFVSTIEAKRYPIYGVQWHPEKAPFEWTPTEQPPHSAVGILLTQAMSNFFVAEARKSAHAFAPADLQAVIIYNYNPIFTGAQGSDFMQEYQWA